MFDQSDYFVESRSNAELRRIVEKHRARIDPNHNGEIDIWKILELGSIETEKGRKALAVIPVADEELGKDDAISTSERHIATLRVKSSVLRAAKEKSETAAHRRAVFTLVHEYFHIALCHDRAPMARATGVNAASTRPRFIPAHQSAEHQANYSTGVLLIDPELARECKTAGEVSLRFNVSMRAAEIFIEERSRHQKSPAVAEGLRALSKSLERSREPRNETRRNEPSSKDKVVCPICGLKTRYGIGGNRSNCPGCKSAGDALQDGDPLIGLEF
ncbi:MAG: hypothetical protein WBQ45_05325 [Roseiarcus sp.]